MRLSEIVIIYLAAAAPVGVVYFLSRRPRGARRTHALARSAAAAFAWPFTLAALWLERRRPARASVLEASRADETRAEEAQRALLAALRRAEELLEETYGAGDERARRVTRAAREGAERYAGLALAAAGADADAPPSPRELELCRIAGRKGDDLLLAGRCLHRNNFTRLVAHRERARQEFLHALAELRDAHGGTRAVPEESRVSSRGSLGAILSEALLQVFARAVELFSAFDDRRAALGVARLLDAECARLRRLQTSDTEHALSRGTEGELCTARPGQPSPNLERLTPPLTRTTPTRA